VSNHLVGLMPGIGALFFKREINTFSSVRRQAGEEDEPGEVPTIFLTRNIFLTVWTERKSGGYNVSVLAELYFVTPGNRGCRT